MRLPADSSRKFLFDDLLRGIHLRNIFYFRPELRAPWGFSVAEHGTVFHFVVRGSCWLQAKGAAKPVPLSAGDFVVVTRGDAHTMRDPPPASTVNFCEVSARLHDLS